MYILYILSVEEGECGAERESAMESESDSESYRIRIEGLWEELCRQADSLP